MSDSKKRYYRKNVELFVLLDKMKLWPSREGVLHGIRQIDKHGDYAEVTTHCGQTFLNIQFKKFQGCALASEQMGSEALSKVQGARLETGEIFKDLF